MLLLFPKARLPLLATLFLLSGLTLSAQERRYVVGTSIDLVGGATNNLSSTSIPVQQPQSLFFFYGAYPSINIESSNPRSVWNAGYGFGVNRMEGQSQLHSNSHSASLSLSSVLSPRWKIGLSDSFAVTNDVASFNAFRGVVPSLQDFRFLFDPVAIRTVSQTNRANGNAEYTMNDRSSLSFGAEHSLRNYDGTGLSGSLSDQQYSSGNVTYSRKTSMYETWTLEYTGSYFRFENFENSFSQRGDVGYSTQIRRDLALGLTVGASHVRTLRTQDTYVGYNTSATLQKTFQTSSLSLYYLQTAGDASGLGSISDTRTAGLSFGHRGQTTSVSVNVSAFDTRARLDNTFSTKGVAGNATVGIRLTRMVSFQAGVMYQHYDQSSPYGFDQKRAFFSLRYENPALFRFSK